ncbi:phosphoglycolate phosphatase [Caldimonas sp. KR1-144]|uniref:phosphoglycolate phosphatase n=1 Tax=Caldimonas sp. KR1-144 TaxID=3400911 RepID=UPI003C03BE30
MYSLYLFDLDGTLVDTAPEITDATNALLASARLPQVDEALVRQWIGHGTRELLAQAVAHVSGRAVDILRGDGTLDALMPAFSLHYLEHCGRRSRVYPQVEAALDGLRDRGARLAVITNKEERFAFPLLERHGLRDYFQLVVCGDTLPAKKPDPMPITHCLKRFSVSAAQAVFVGDSEIDVKTARAAGVACWAVPYGYNHGRPIQSAGPDRVIESFAELVEQPERRLLLID